jgi:adenylate kinase
LFRLILLGPPGAGKGTNAVLIAKRYDILHISTGDIFRKNLNADTPLGRKAKEYMEKGELVPDALVTELVTNRLEEEDCSDGYLLDGFPRTVVQAQALDEYLKSKGQAIDKVLELHAPEDILMERMLGRRVCRSCGATYNIKGMAPKKEGVCDICGGEVYQRADDTEGTVNKRFAVYREQTEPLIEYYRKAGNLVRVDSSAGYKKTDAYITAILGARI